MLHVIDPKYGKGVPVSVEENPQMMLYAIGRNINKYHRFLHEKIKKFEEKTTEKTA